MKPEAQRIAIAQSLGFKKEVGCTGIVRWRRGDELFDELPDYLNDLNAMHEAGKALPDKGLYRLFLYLVVCEDPMNKWNESAFATAAQRAEAFLKTLDLWTDET